MRSRLGCQVTAVSALCLFSVNKMYLLCNNSLRPLCYDGREREARAGRTVQANQTTRGAIGVTTVWHEVRFLRDDPTRDRHALESNNQKKVNDEVDLA